jgi:hypothetical protein
MRVFYVSGYAGEVYYVRAKDEKDADEILRKAIGKYLFKTNLQDDEIIQHPDTLGDNIIVEFGISKGTLEANLQFEDITASAYVFSENDMPHWKDWKITTADIIGDSNVAKSLEETIFGKKEDV